jgi:hypothetical protein
MGRVLFFRILKAADLEASWITHLSTYCIIWPAYEMNVKIGLIEYIRIQSEFAHVSMIYEASSL